MDGGSIAYITIRHICSIAVLRSSLLVAAGIVFRLRGILAPQIGFQPAGIDALRRPIQLLVEAPQPVATTPLSSDARLATTKRPPPFFH